MLLRKGSRDNNMQHKAKHVDTENDSTPYTSCEEYGHNYAADEDSNVVYCTDCGDSYTIEEN